MAWIESHQEVSGHPKTRKLARLLGVSVPTAVGHLHCLWHWALTHAFDGDLSGWDPEDIAIGAMWDDDPALLIDGLVEARGRSGSGFLDRSEGTLRLHDWESYTAHLRARKESAQKANHVRWHSGRKVYDPACEWCRSESESERSPTASEPESTKPEPEPNQTSPTSSSPDVDDDAAASPFAQRLISEGFDPNDVVAVVQRFTDRREFGGAPITDPMAWARSILPKLRAKREEVETDKGPRRAVLDDGETWEYDPDKGTWEIAA